MLTHGGARVFRWSVIIWGLVSRRCLISAVVIFVTIASPVAAWGVRGHKIIAIIAEQHLTLHARQRVHLLLADEGKSSMQEVANWADGVRHLKVPVQPSHSVRLKGGDEPYNPAEDCPAQNCILAAIDAIVSVLNQPTARREAQVQALKYLIHFVGDVHMPLHATREGRDIEVVFHNRKVTLHKVWDTYIVSTQRGEVSKIAHRIMVSSEEQYGGGSPVQWALESRNLARDVILVGPLAHPQGLVNLPATYAGDNWWVVRKRLNLAGLRLAALLNTIFTHSEVSGASEDEDD